MPAPVPSSAIRRPGSPRPASPGTGRCRAGWPTAAVAGIVAVNREANLPRCGDGALDQGGSVGRRLSRLATICPDRQRGEDHHDAERPEHGLPGQHRHRAAGHQAPAGGASRVIGLALRERLQPAGHGGARAEQQAAGEHDREHRGEPEGLHSLRGLDQPARSAPRSSTWPAANSSQAAGRQQRPAGWWRCDSPAPSRSPASRATEMMYRVTLAEDRARERRPAGNRQAAEPAEHARGDIRR